MLNQVNQTAPYSGRDSTDDKLLDVVESMFGDIEVRLGKLNAEALELAERILGSEPEALPPNQAHSQLLPHAAQRIRYRFEEISRELMRAEYLIGRLGNIG